MVLNGDTVPGKACVAHGNTTDASKYGSSLRHWKLKEQWSQSHESLRPRVFGDQRNRSTVEHCRVKIQDAAIAAHHEAQALKQPL